MLLVAESLRRKRQPDIAVISISQAYDVPRTRYETKGVLTEGKMSHFVVAVSRNTNISRSHVFAAFDAVVQKAEVPDLVHPEEPATKSAFRTPTTSKKEI